jgi:hypothetical protein
MERIDVAEIEFHNRTLLNTYRLRTLCHEVTEGWAVGRITVRFRYSRGADFSGTCFYRDRRIFVNLGKHLTYPYRMVTHVARAKTIGRHWYKPRYIITVTDGYQLGIFIYLHELFHLLVKRARRNTRQKESMCDRFATRFLVDRFGIVVETDKGEAVARSEWDFQDLEGFVEAARDKRVWRPQGSIAVPERVIASPRPQAARVRFGEQLTLFPVG